MRRVGIELPQIEVRYENLSIEADVYVGKRALPTLLNSAINVFEVRTGFRHSHITRMYLFVSSSSRHKVLILAFGHPTSRRIP
jgi:hypothetical protein